jgi:hypothetical protein
MEGQLLERVAARFPRVETRQRFTRFLRAMLAELPRKTCWSIAEHAGEQNPDGMQHLKSRNGINRKGGMPLTSAVTT